MTVCVLYGHCDNAQYYCIYVYIYLTTKETLHILCEISVCLCFVMHYICIHSMFTFIMKRKRKLVALLLLSYRCIATLNALQLFLTVPWIGLQCAIVVCPYHTHLLNLLSVSIFCSHITTI